MSHHVYNLNHISKAGKTVFSVLEFDAYSIYCQLCIQVDIKLHLLVSGHDLVHSSYIWLHTIMPFIMNHWACITWPLVVFTFAWVTSSKQVIQYIIIDSIADSTKCRNVLGLFDVLYSEKWHQACIRSFIIEDDGRCFAKMHQMLMWSRWRMLMFFCETDAVGWC